MVVVLLYVVAMALLLAVPVYWWHLATQAGRKPTESDRQDVSAQRELTAALAPEDKEWLRQHGATWLIEAPKYAPALRVGLTFQQAAENLAAFAKPAPVEREREWSEDNGETWHSGPQPWGGDGRGRTLWRYQIRE